MSFPRWHEDKDWSKHLLRGSLFVAAITSIAVWLTANRHAAEPAAQDNAAYAVSNDGGRPDHLDSPALPLEIVVQQRLASGQTRVYECVTDGVKSLSDRPCGPGAAGRIVDTRELNTYRNVPAAPVDMRRYRQPATSAEYPHATEQGRGSQLQGRCQAIQERIDAINRRMRHPYTRWEGEYYRAEWHKAKQAYYDEGCGRP